MNAEIVSIGNELLIGDTVNTNASWLGQLLTEEGIEVTGIHTIGDDLDTVKRTIRSAMKQAGLVITTGGLGPTHDDVTKKALQELFDVGSVIDESVLSFVKSVFEKRNIPFTQSNYHQAEIPENADLLFNKQGTAPGLWFREFGSLLVVLPGVPFEMKHLMTEKVMPKLQKEMPRNQVWRSRYLVTAGVGESTLSDEIIGDLGDLLGPKLTVAYLPGPHGTRIRITGAGDTEEQVESEIREVADHIYDKAGTVIIGEGKSLSLGEALGLLLREQNSTIAVAESCTGGSLAGSITDIPGSSDYMLGGVVAYANSVKKEQLGVSENDLMEHGAVSKPVALQMAQQVARNLGADIGISTTGIAGPGGGTPEKPVGTVWIGFWSREQHFALHALFTNDRLINKERTIAVALEATRRIPLKINTMPYGLEPEWV